MFEFRMNDGVLLNFVFLITQRSSISPGAGEKYRNRSPEPEAKKIKREDVHVSHDVIIVQGWAHVSLLLL